MKPVGDTLAPRAALAAATCNDPARGPARGAAARAITSAHFCSLLLVGGDVEHEVDDVSVLDQVLLALLPVLARRLDGVHPLLSAMLHPVGVAAHLVRVRFRARVRAKARARARARARVRVRARVS